MATASVPSHPDQPGAGSRRRSPGLLDDLLDVTFTRFVALRLLPVLYVLVLLCTGLVALVAVLQGFAGGFAAGVLALLLSVLGWLLVAVLARVSIEGFAVVLRIHDNTDRLVDALAPGAGVPTGSTGRRAAEPPAPTASPSPQPASPSAAGPPSAAVPLPAPPVEALPAPEPVTAVQPAYQDEPDGGVHAQIFGVAPPRTSGRRDRTGGPAPYEQQPDGDDPRFGDARFDDPLFDDPRFDAPRFDDPLFDDARFDGRPPDERPYEGQRQDDPRLDVPRRPDSRREARRDPRRPAWDSQDLPPAEPPAPRR